MKLSKKVFLFLPISIDAEPFQFKPFTKPQYIFAPKNELNLVQFNLPPCTAVWDGVAVTSSILRVLTSAAVVSTLPTRAKAPWKYSDWQNYGNYQSCHHCLEHSLHGKYVSKETKNSKYSISPTTIHN